MRLQIKDGHGCKKYQAYLVNYGEVKVLATTYAEVSAIIKTGLNWILVQTLM